MEARDVMTTPVITVRPDTPVEELARLMLARRISAVPVVDESGRLRGIVSEGDLMRRPESGTVGPRSWWLDLVAGFDQRPLDYLKSHGRSAADVMTRNVVTVTERTPLDRIAALLERRRIKRVPVLRAGRVVGVVSRANLLHGLATGRPARASKAIDREIRSHISQELERAGVQAIHLNIVVTNGVVECWGFVDTEAQKRALRLVLKSAPGVKKVTDNAIVLAGQLAASMGAQ